SEPHRSGCMWSHPRGARFDTADISPRGPPSAHRHAASSSSKERAHRIQYRSPASSKEAQHPAVCRDLYPQARSSNIAAMSRPFVSANPGRDVQRVGTARFLGQDPTKIYEPVWGVLGNLGDSQCYVGVTHKVEAIHAALSDRIERDDLGVRLIPPAFTI